MNRSLAVLLLAGCATLQVQAQVQIRDRHQAQAPSVQASTEQAPEPEQKPADQTTDQNPPQPAAENHTAESAPPATAQTDFPLDRFKEFSAIMTGGPLPGGDWEGHIYRSGDLMRMQGQQQAPTFMITDLMKQQTHGLSATGCIKFNYPYSRAYPFMLAGPDKKYELAPVGEETVDGHQCRIEDLTITSPKLQQPLKLRLWEAEDLQGFPVKIENLRSHRTIQYKNVVLGPQDPTLFIYPTHCQRTEGMTKKAKQAPPGNSKK
jgi:hypothetical protein